MSRTSRRTRIVLAVITLAAFGLGGLALAYRHYEQQFMLSVVPDALGVTTVSYRREESWGWGPGGNEAGIRTYPLPELVAQTIEREGLQFLQQMPPSSRDPDRGWRGHYSDWAATPIHPGPQWPAQPGEEQRMEITDYICAYGFCIDIDPAVAQEANAIVNTPGAFYARGRIGLLIVSPAHRKVLYLYNG